jgi:hypothetical protein
MMTNPKWIAGEIEAARERGRRTMALTVDAIEELYRAARAVVDLVDGAGGDAHEQDRGCEIATRLLQIAAGDPPTTPLLDHDQARVQWEKHEDDSEGADENGRVPDNGLIGPQT